MFAIGDKIVYPMHGAGVIEAIEEKEVLGEVMSYYVLHIPHGNMQVLVPVSSSEQVGLRSIIDGGFVDRVYEVLSGESTEMDPNWNRRNRENLDKMKTGDVCLVAEVVRNLTRVDRVKKLSMGEKKLLGNARHILISELTLVEGKSEETVSDMIDKAI